MKLILIGLGIALGGLTLLMLMVIRLIEPGLALSFLAYAAAFAGTFVGLAGVIGLVQRMR